MHDDMVIQWCDSIYTYAYTNGDSWFNAYYYFLYTYRWMRNDVLIHDSRTIMSYDFTPSLTYIPIRPIFWNQSDWWSLHIMIAIYSRLISAWWITVMYPDLGQTCWFYSCPDHFLREPPSSKHWNFWKCCVEPRQKRSTKRSTSNSARPRRSQPCRR